MYSKQLWGLLFIIFLNSTGIGFFLSVANAEEPVEYYSSENILKFAEHLMQQRDYLRAAGEYQRYLFYNPKEKEEINYWIALCYRFGGKTEKAIDSFIDYLQEFPESKYASHAYYQIGVSHFLMQRYEETAKYLNTSVPRITDVQYKYESQHLIGLSYLMQRQWHTAEEIFNKLQQSEILSVREKAKAYSKYATQGTKLPTCSPFLAGFFSTIVPGAGRLYTGRVGDAFTSLILVGLTGWQTYDGFNRDGIASVKGWTLGTLGTIFYAGNIYGSVISARIYNREITEEFLSGIAIELVY